MTFRASLLPAALLLLAAAPPVPPPAWEARQAKTDAADVATSIYVVRPGDSLSRVVEATGAGADAIARANKLSSPFVLRPGQKLQIPAGRYHIVRRGEAGIAIARAYGVDWSRIATLNHLQEPYQLRAGDRLLVPSKTEVAHMSLEQRAAAFRIDIDDLVTGSEPALAEKAKPAPPTPSPRKALALAPTTPVAEPAQNFSGRFAWPLVGKILRSFGPQASGARNDGINIQATAGSPVLAAADGVVAYAGPLAGFGQLVLVRHGGGWLTAYGYAQSISVARGQSVSRGQTIARAGATGSASEPQLHFEIREGRRPLDPLSLLPRS
jgi:murein DD-endopeptidase MepM/ murein hydrolase activator NlpD